MERYALIVPIGLAGLLLGVYALTVRREAVPQILGLLAMENGAFFAGVAIAPELPLIAELAVAFDVLVLAFVVGILTRTVHERIGTTAVGESNQASRGAASMILLILILLPLVAAGLAVFSRPARLSQIITLVSCPGHTGTVSMVFFSGYKCSGSRICGLPRMDRPGWLERHHPPSGGSDICYGSDLLYRLYEVR